MTTIRITAWIGLLAVLLPLRAASPAEELSPQGRRVVEYLLEDWKTHMHSTSIPLAMQNLGIPPDDELRLEVGKHFRQHPELANNLRWWGANNYLLSNEEKRIAKFLIGQEAASGEFLSLAEISRELELREDRLRGRLEFLARAGLLEPATTGEPAYRLAEQAASWGGPLRYNYHTITIGDGKPFDVW